MSNLKKIFLLLPILTLIISCQDKVEETYLVTTPIYMAYDNLRTSFKVSDGQEIVQSGKIYFKDNFIFVNEYQKGIHVVDNTDPSNPLIAKFIEIPGNVDMAIKGNMLFADSYIDLLTIDISDINDIKEVDRDTNVFPYIIPEYDEGGIIDNIDQSRGVIIGYELIEVTERVTANNYDYTRFPSWEIDMVFNDAVSAPKGNGSNVGVGGSMARFTLWGNYLYTVDNSSLKLFDVSNTSNPVYQKDIPISWNIETIFPYENKLFIGSQTGMYVFSIINPANPEFISEFRHASSCDPVVVEGNYAYVTLRGGNLCGAIESQLNVIDISVIEDPKFVKAYSMTEPYGLGIDNDVLFVCDGSAGLKVYDATDKLAIADNQIAVYPDVNAFDVIPLGDVLIMIGVDGLYQYNYADLENITQLSHIPIYGN